MAALRDALATPPPAPLFAPPEPRRLRPCCAFGHDLRVKIGFLPVPFFRLETVRGPKDIGPHEYDPGLLQILPSPVPRDDQHPAREHNGIVYTCRGGFLDTAHVRDFADLTWFLAARVERRLASGGTIELEDLGGRRRVLVRAVPARVLERIGAASLAVASAARLSFELSVWREIATWYGYESVPPWPENISSFSLEDLPSNLLGTKIASGILRTTAITGRRDWDRAMTAWLPAACETLGIVPKEQVAAAMQAVDGSWWDSARRVPDWKVTRRRVFAAAPVIEPSLVDAQGMTCPSQDAAEPLRLEESFRGVALGEVATVEIVADESLVRHGLPLPHSGDRRVGARDFPAMMSAIASDTAAGLAQARVAGDETSEEARATRLEEARAAARE